MGRKSLLILTLSLIAILFAYPVASQAVELKEGMTQGEFALWLVRAIGALQEPDPQHAIGIKSKLPPGANADDAINFLTQLAVVPKGGWEKDDPVTKELFVDLVGDPEVANLDFNDGAEKVSDFIQMRFGGRPGRSYFPIQSEGRSAFAEEPEKDHEDGSEEKSFEGGTVVTL
jgi:hypothetical protein